MSSGDMFQPGKEVVLKISEYEELIRARANGEFLKKAIYADLPREMIVRVITGKHPKLEEYESTGMSPDEIREMSARLEEAESSIKLHAEREKSLQEAIEMIQSEYNEKYEEMKRLADSLGEELEEAEKKLEEAEKKLKAQKEKETKKKPLKGTGPQRKELDMGKVRALREAGWSLKNIGDEMGCSPQTIANALQEGRE